jgi:isopentenyl phosphate kinase
MRLRTWQKSDVLRIDEWKNSACRGILAGFVLSADDKQSIVFIETGGSFGEKDVQAVAISSPSEGVIRGFYAKDKRAMLKLLKKVANKIAAAYWAVLVTRSVKDELEKWGIPKGIKERIALAWEAPK